MQPTKEIKRPDSGLGHLHRRRFSICQMTRPKIFFVLASLLSAPKKCITVFMQIIFKYSNLKHCIASKDQCFAHVRNMMTDFLATDKYKYNFFGSPVTIIMRDNAEQGI